jgi:hypothetical protein
MKKLLLLTLLLTTAALFALEPDAELIKNGMPDVYKAIADRASIEWSDDYTMQVYTINNQCKSFVGCFKLNKTNESQDIFLKLAYKWADVDLTGYNDIFVAPVDWCMVEYELGNNIAAKKELE